MRKSETLMIRIDPDLKRRSESAARRAGRTLSAFVLHAIERETHHVEKREQRVVESTPKSFSGVPTFFRAACATAQSGGEFGYDNAGFALAGALESLVPYDAEGGEWDDALEELRESARAEDYEAVIAWFKNSMPKCLELVPSRRRERFAEGVCRYEAEKGI